jgi:hypothetical protein
VFEEWLASPSLPREPGGLEFSFEQPSAGSLVLLTDLSMNLPSVPAADMQDSLLAASGGDTILSSAEISAVLSPSLEDTSLLFAAPPISRVAAAARKSVAARAPPMNAANAVLLDAEAIDRIHPRLSLLVKDHGTHLGWDLSSDGH